MITEPLPSVLLGLVVVSWFPASVALGVGILLIDALERSEVKVPRLLSVEIDVVSSLPPDDRGKAVKGLSWGPVAVRFRELRPLVLLADGEFEWVLCELDRTVAEEFDVLLDGAESPVPEIVVFVILVVERIDWDEFRAVLDRSVTGPNVVALEALLCSDTELVILGVPASIVVFNKATELEGLAVVIGIVAGFVEFEADDRPLDVGFFEPLLGMEFTLVEPGELLALGCWVEPLSLPFESAAPFDTVVDAVNPMTPGFRPAMEPFEEVRFDDRTLIAVVLFEICPLSAPVPGVETSIEMASGRVISESDGASPRERVSSWALMAIFVVVICVSVMIVAPALAAIKYVKR
jgi:hypothetical protein